VSLKAARIAQEGTKVLLEIDGRGWTLDWRAALALADAIRTQAKKAEELAHAPGIIADQALVIRKGLPFGLTSHPGMLREAVKEAAWGRWLRRALPGGIRSTAVVGTPAVIQTRGTR
jgi:hypothetical protein